MNCPSQADVVLGLECLDDGLPGASSNSRFGLLINQASVDRQLKYAHHVLGQPSRLGRLAAIFSPQHGLWGEQQANMIETPHAVDARLGTPMFSLYSETRCPTPTMLKDLDLMVIDLQDVGTRVYTYIWTIALCLRACAERNLPVVVLDRPNPLGGCVVEGPVLDPGFTSFVGMAPIPMRHGLTVGEMARVCNAWLDLHADLTVVPMRGWSSDMLFPATKRTWVLPSPNMPRFETALVYPGQVLVEGTNLSEGRGTTMPFEVIGAPFIDPERLLEALPEMRPFGVQLRPMYFVPTFDKWQGHRCGGVAWHLAKCQETVRSYAVTVHLLTTIAQLWPDAFQWLDPPYEYEFDKPPIDILSGNSDLRREVERARRGQSPSLDAVIDVDAPSWWRHVHPFLLYERPAHLFVDE